MIDDALCRQDIILYSDNFAQTLNLEKMITKFIAQIQRLSQNVRPDSPKSFERDQTMLDSLY